MSRRLNAIPSVYFLCFFLSGFAGLVYQIVWVRLAFSAFGIITPVLSVVVSIFMCGLGLGALFGGRVVRDASSRRALVIYAVTECLVAFFACAVPLLFGWGQERLLAAGSMNSLTYLAASALTIGLSIFPACFLMGATVPVMMGFLKQAYSDATSFSFLYLANLLGAFSGTVATAFVLIELCGFRSTCYGAASLNVLAALFALTKSIPQKAESRTISDAAFDDNIQSARSEAPNMSLAALLTTGVVSMAAEVLWTRGFTPVLGTTIYAFACILAVYLLATGVGTWIYRTGYGRRFSFSTVLTATAFSSFLPVLLNDPRIHGGVIAVVAGLVPFCLLLGYVTPCIVDRYSQGSPALAARAYAINTVGCVVGPLIASYCVLPFMGFRVGIALLGIILVMVAALWPPTGLRRVVAFSVAGILVAVVCSAGARSYEDWPYYSHPGATIRRDYAGTVIAYGSGYQKQLLVNGVGITVLTPLTKMMAHLPIMAHPKRPERALMICFGMGTTYRSLLRWGLDTTAVELVPNVPTVFPYFFDDANSFLSHPKGHLVIDDGRRFLRRDSHTYDIVTLDPPPPVEAAGSSLLYSKEFYDDVKRHLAPDGVLQQWWPGGEAAILGAVAQTLSNSFPYVRVYKGLGQTGFHFLASRQPLRVRTPEEFIALMPPEVKEDFLEWGGGASLLTLVKPVTAFEIPIGAVTALAHAQTVSDDRPFNEYYWFRRWRDKDSTVYYR